MSLELVNNVTMSFYVVAILTTLFFIYSLYLIFYISTPAMRIYKYFLLNIQVATYAEATFYSVFMSLIWMNPYFGINADGLLWKLFRVPTKYSFGLYTGLYCCVTSALCAAYFYRYQLLLSASDINFSNRLLTIIIASTYIVSVSISLPLATMAFMEHNESVAAIRKIDTEAYLGDSFILLGGPTALQWVYYATALAAVSFVIFVVIIKHTSIILRNQARFSEMSRKMHQNAMSGLIVQTTTISATVCFPVLMLCISYYIGQSLVTSTDAYVWIGSVVSSVKSFGATMAMIVMTKCYREHLMSITCFNRIWPRAELAPPAQTTMTSTTI